MCRAAETMEKILFIIDGKRRRLFIMERTQRMIFPPVLLNRDTPGDHFRKQEVGAKSVYESGRKPHILPNMKKMLNATSYSIELDGEHLPIMVRRLSTSRRIIIRYQPLHHALSLTLPRYVSIRQGLRFVEEKREWIARQLKDRPPKISFSDGQVIPLLGNRYQLRHVGGRGVVAVDGQVITVPGDPEFMPRRVRDWLKAHAKENITRLAHERAAQINKTIKRITLRDTHSHWGSCTEEGRISFSWRLILAPYEVFDYVVSHEVAHLQHLDHSEAFWSVVASLVPDYEQAKTWLKQNGNTLYAYG